jgi:RNA recognition motif-containing protein
MRPSNFQGNIHIINFPISTTAAELAALFDDYGLVLGAHIKTIASDGGHLRLGIVAMAPDNAADKAIEALQGHVLGGQKLKLKRAKPPVKGERKAAPRRPLDRMERPQRADQMDRQDRPQRVDRPVSAPAERFPARAPAGPPRQVIVEYRGRRGSRLISG